MGKARLQGCVHPSLGTGQPRRVPGSLPGKPFWWGRGGNWRYQGSSCFHSHIPALPRSIKPGDQMEELAVQALLPAFQQLQARLFPKDTHPGWSRAVWQWCRACLQHQFLQHPRSCPWCVAGDGQPAASKLEVTRVLGLKGVYVCVCAQPQPLFLHILNSAQFLSPFLLQGGWGWLLDWSTTHR